MTIGEKIKQKRIEKKLSQRELGEKLHVSQQMIGQYEKSGYTLKPTTIKKIANALDVTEQELLGYSDKEYVLYKAYEDSEPDEQNGSIVIDGILVTEKNLLRHYNALNRIGKAQAIKRVSELKYIPEFAGEDNIPFT